MASATGREKEIAQNEQCPEKSCRPTPSPQPLKDANENSENSSSSTSGLSERTPSGSSSERASTPGITPSKQSHSSLLIDHDHEDYEQHMFPAENLFEYQWPEKSDNWYILQEQISEYLMVKSFKRKYPDLKRRPVEVKEKEFLREKGVVTETQCDLGLTALRCEEVYDLMLKDYPEKYQEYSAVLHERERQTISDKHKEYEVPPKLEKSKMADYVKKAMRSAAEFNSHFQRERREERRAYFDLQTMVIHHPVNKYRKLSSEATKVSSYPVSLIPGQFQEYHKRYVPEELKYFPINTTIYGPPKKLKNILVPSGESSEELEDSMEEQHDSFSDGDSNGNESSDSDNSQHVVELTTRPRTRKQASEAQAAEKRCRVCKRGPIKGKDVQMEELVQCSECENPGHPACLELTREMVKVIKSYPWQCMECKTCVKCMDPYDEDKMMFCDKCDRGYHTFCVGLKGIPTGRWECTSCRDEIIAIPARARRSRH